MASNVNTGNQKITFDFKQPAKGSEFTRLLFSIIKPGIYKGLDVSIASETQLNISTGHAFLNCLYQSQTIRTVTVEFTTNFSINIPQSVPGQNEIIYLYYSYSQVIDNYVEINHINAGSIDDIPSQAVILCEVSYNLSGFISEILYEKRSYGLFDYSSNYSLPDIDLKFSSYLDKTKKFRYNISNVTSGQTRIIGIPDYDYNIGTVDDWSAGRKYSVKELVLYNSTLYRCNSIHTSSGDFFSDLSRWDNITEVQNEERTRAYSATGVNAARVVTIIGDYPIQQIPSIDYITSYEDEPFGITVSSISAGQVGDIIQRGRLVLSSFDSASGSVGQKVYSNINGTLTLSITPLVVGQLITPSATDSVIYVGILPAEEGIDPINFGGQLSSSEDTIQKAFDRLDDYGYTPTWVTGASYRLNNSVNYNGNIYRCISSHISTSTFDLTKWTIDETLITDKFTGQLKPTENTIQSVFDRLDDFGYVPVWASGQVYRVSNVVISNSVIYRSLTDHTSSSDFLSDIINWTQVNEAPIIPQDPNTYYAGDKVFRTVQKEQVEGIKISQAPSFSAVRVNELDFNSITLDSASGNILALSSNNKSFVKLTGVNVAIHGIQAPTGTFAQYIAISNTTGSNITVGNESLSSNDPDRILTGVGNSIIIPSDTTITLLYDFYSFRWRIVGSSVSNHNLLFNLQGGDGTNYYHSDQPINRSDDVVFNSVTVKTGTSASGSTIVNGIVAPNQSPGVSGNIGTTYIQTNGVQWTKVGSGNTDWRADWIGNLTNESTGFPVANDGEVDRTSSNLTFNNTSRTLTISPTGSSYSIVIKNREIVKTAPESITILNISGSYFVYFDENGTLQYSTSFTLDMIYKFVYVAIIYWSSTQGQATYIGDERHGCVMDAHTHARFHQTTGAVFISGSALNGFNIDGDGTNSNQTQFSIGSGNIRDEDILHILGQKFTTDSIPVLYRLNNEWVKAVNANQKFHYNSRAYWNSNISGNYSLAEVANNNFCLYHIVATNDKDNPYFSMMGLNQYNSKSGAREGAINEITQFEGLPFQEFVFIATIIFESKDSYTNTGKSRIVSTDTGSAYVDWRFASYLNPSTANVNNHNNLGGLQGGLGGNFYHSNQPINSTDSVSFASVNSENISTVDLDVSGMSSLQNVSASGVEAASLKVNTLTYPSLDGIEGQAIVTDGLGNLSFGNVSSGGSLTYNILEVPPSNLKPGMPVYWNGTTYAPAGASTTNKVPTAIVKEIQLSDYTVQFGGILTLSNTEWDQITSASGGLTTASSGCNYYASALVDGEIVNISPIFSIPVLNCIKNDGIESTVEIKFGTLSSLAISDSFYRQSEVFTGNGSNLNYTVSLTPYSRSTTSASINGVNQQSDSFSISGKTIIFSEAPPFQAEIEINYAVKKDLNYANITKHTETPTIAKNSFILPIAPLSKNEVMVWVGGSYQDSNNFTLSNSTLTLDTNVDPGVKVQFVIFSSVQFSDFAYIKRRSVTLSNLFTSTLTNIFGDQLGGRYDFHLVSDPLIGGTIRLQESTPEITIRIETFSLDISSTQGTASKLNIYITSNNLIFENRLGSDITLVLERHQ